MAGKLVKCPTCKREMSATAECCPYCGEADFITLHTRNGRVVDCDICYGKGWYSSEDMVGFSYPGLVCCKCKGSGCRQLKEDFGVDIRTGEENAYYSHHYDEVCARPASWPALSTPSSSCLSIIIIALSLAASLVFAIRL